MRLFRIRENTTDIHFSADGDRVAAPSDVSGEVVIQGLVPTPAGRLPPESRFFAGEGAAFLGWQGDKAFRLFEPASEDAPARVVARSLAGRGEETLLELPEPAFAKGGVYDPDLRFAAPAEAGPEMPIVDVRSKRSSAYLARRRENRIVAQRFTAAGLVLSDRSPKAEFGPVHLVDPLRARPIFSLEDAVALVPAPSGGVALAVIAAPAEKVLRAELVRPRSGGPPAFVLATYPLSSPEAKWLLVVAPRPSYRPFSGDGHELVLPDKDGSVRVLTGRPRDRTGLKFFRGAVYSPQGTRLAGPGAGISVEATFLCVEAAQRPPGTR